MTTPWKSAFLNALAKDPKAVSYSLSTVDTAKEIPSPHVRSVMHRGFLDTSKTPSLHLLYTTTDIRTPKAHQIHSYPGSEATSNAEIVWWGPESSEQFRISGIIHLLPNSAHPWHADFAADYLGLPNGFNSWEERRRRAYNDLSPFLRASFCRPIPGSPLERYEDMEKYPQQLSKIGEAQDEKEKEHIQKALENFSLVLLEPLHVDRVEFKPIPNRRTFYTRKGLGEWEEAIVVP